MSASPSARRTRSLAAAPPDARPGPAAEVDARSALSHHHGKTPERRFADVHDKTAPTTPPPPTVQPRRQRGAARLAALSVARRFRGDRPPPAAEIPLRLHLRRRRDRCCGARQSKRLRRIRLRAARAQRRLRPRSDHDAVRQDLCGAVRHSADGLVGAVRLSRRHRADARGRRHEPADDPERIVADHAGGRASAPIPMPGTRPISPASPRASSRWSTASPPPATTPSS